MLSVLYEIWILNPLSSKHDLSKATWKAKLEFFLTYYWNIVEGSVEIPGPWGPYKIAWTSYRSIEHLFPTLIDATIGCSWSSTVENLADTWKSKLSNTTELFWIKQFLKFLLYPWNYLG